VNLGGPGVTSPGWGSFALSILSGLEPILGGRDAAFSLFHQGWRQSNPSLVYAETQNKGFFAVKATKTTHTAEYFLIKPNTTLSTFSAARAASGKITADFTCGSSLVTTAGAKGSLVPQAACSAIQYDTARPAVWNIPFPLDSADVGVVKLSRCNMDACLFNADLAATKSPTRSPVKAAADTKMPSKSPVKVTAAPSVKSSKCGLFGLRIICLRTRCGIVGRILGWCKN
jgi:hypothetical protein